MFPWSKLSPLDIAVFATLQHWIGSLTSVIELGTHGCQKPWIGSFTSVMDLHICDCAELTSRSEEMHSLKSLPTLKNFHCWNLLEDAKRKHFKFKNRESHAWCRFHQYRETFQISSCIRRVWIFLLGSTWNHCLHSSISQLKITWQKFWTAKKFVMAHKFLSTRWLMEEGPAFFRIQVYPLPYITG